MTRTLLEEENIISLRTAFVDDDGDVVDFRLLPAWLGSSVPKNSDWTSKDYAWLYRHMRSPDEEKKLLCGFPCLEQTIKPMLFEDPPKFKLLWKDSGNSVALYLNGEPWAFIYEKTQKGYSKGIQNSAKVNSWDEGLFLRIFSSAESRL